MECNKEEAVRVRDLAEQKLKEKDYTGAHKVVLKARKLYPELENLNQIVAVCEVQCAASTKVNGESDWYGILQVGTTADDLEIKKAYRKLALLLHPDKNKFAGAEAAFKLIGEANGILTDRGKRSLHDMKRNAKPSLGQVRRAPAPAARANRGSAGNATPNGPSSNQTGLNQTFWTMCDSCGMRYQYYRSILKKALRCQNCLKPFIAYDINEQGRPSGTSNGVNPNPNLRSDSSNGPSREPFHSFTSPSRDQSQGGAQNANTSTRTTANGHQKFERVNLGNANQKGGPTPGPRMGTRPAAAQASPTNLPPVNSNKRKRMVVEEDSEDSTDSGDSEDEIILDQKVQQNGTNNPPRRSCRQKPDVSYNEKAYGDDDLDDNDNIDDGDENGEDDDFLEDHERKQQRNESNEAADVPTEEEMEADPSSGVKEIVYQEAEFFHFDTLRDRTKFAVDQVWAVYDDKEGMPRFYARIKSLCTSPKVQIRFTWLEPDPDQSALVWHRAGLPIATGMFKLGRTQHDDELLMFSHVVSCWKGDKKNTFCIYPRKGEIWAMFKDWDSSWSSKSVKHKEFAYEMVQVVSDFTDSTGFVVIPLVKINGYVSLFMQSSEAAPVVIPTSEILKFSHNVPLYRTTGNERNGVPEGAFELDPASLPPDLDSAFSSIDLDPNLMQKHNINSTSAHKEEKKEEMKEHTRMQEGDMENTSLPESPNYEFYCFENDRSIEKFKPGETWALYSEINTLPNYYAMVNRVELEKKCVHIKWLEPYGEGVVGEGKRWINSRFPLGCGTFSLGGTDCFDIGAFSHKMTAKLVAGKNVYEIIPAATEIWAMYHKWSTGWSKNDIENCQYDLVRVSEVMRTGFKVYLLAKVVGYRAVFRLDPKKKLIEIPKRELVRFSHRVPAHRLTHAAGGTLSGNWELDTASLPESLLC
jgi:curved DNA-binding protein CbpA